MAKKLSSIVAVVPKDIEEAKRLRRDAKLSFANEEDYFKSKLPEFVIEIVDFLGKNTISSYNSHISENVLHEWIKYYLKTHPNIKQEEFYPNLLRLINIFSNNVVVAYHQSIKEIIRSNKKTWEQEKEMTKKMTFSVQDVIALKDIFGIKTENTLGKYLNNGTIKGRSVRGKWQISREALIEYIGHDDF